MTYPVPVADCPDGQVYSHYHGRCMPLSFLADGAAQAIRAYEQASDGRDWYANAGALVYDIFGAEPGDLFMRFVSAMSVNMPLSRNIPAAIQAVRAYTQGIPFVEAEYAPGRRERMRSLVFQYRRVAEGMRFTPRAIKLSHFDAALRGDPNAVAVDRWVWRYVMGDDGRVDYEYASMVVNAVRKAAAMIDLQPRELQAIIWWTAITESNRQTFVEVADEWRREMREAAAALRDADLPQIPPILEPPDVTGQATFADPGAILDALQALAEFKADVLDRAIQFVEALEAAGIDLSKIRMRSKATAGAVGLTIGAAGFWFLTREQ